MQCIQLKETSEKSYVYLSKSDEANLQVENILIDYLIKYQRIGCNVFLGHQLKTGKNDEDFLNHLEIVLLFRLKP